MSNPKGKPSDPPTIEFSVRVMKDGQAAWESSVVQPLFASEARQKATTEAWMDLMLAGLKMSQLLRPEQEQPHDPR